MWSRWRASVGLYQESRNPFLWVPWIFPANRRYMHKCTLSPLPHNDIYYYIQYCGDKNNWDNIIITNNIIVVVCCCCVEFYSVEIVVRTFFGDYWLSKYAFCGIVRHTLHIHLLKSRIHAGPSGIYSCEWALKCSKVVQSHFVHRA